MEPFSPSIPDSVVLAVSWIFLLLLLAFQRNVLGPKFSTYRNLSSTEQYDWDQRALNLAFQVSQIIFNCHILFLCAETARSPLYGYTPVAHTGFLVIAAFYFFDAALFVAHPETTHVVGWTAHHLFAAGMLIWLTAFQRTSALPASAFLISAAGHIFNELRWFFRTTGARHARHMREVYNAISVVCNVVLFATCVVPPPYLVLLSARQRGVTLRVMFSEKMRWACVVCYWIVWLPHCLLFAVQVKRTLRHWGGVPQESKGTAKQL